VLDQDIRRTILHLHRQGHGIRAIARAVGHSRKAVRAVLRHGAEEVPALERPELAAEHDERIRALFLACKGNRVRVAEELAAEGIEISYSTLTAFCRRHGIGVVEKKRAGEYDLGAALLEQ
jgi:transposase